MTRRYRIQLVIGDDYLEELDRRLRAYGITRAELARQWGKNPSHVSRMFNKGVVPRIDEIKKIEVAVAQIRARKEAELEQIVDVEVEEIE